MKRHLIASSMAIGVVLILFLARIIEWILATSLLLLLFPYISFSIFFSLAKGEKRKQAIDIEWKRRKTLS